MLEGKIAGQDRCSTAIENGGGGGERGRESRESRLRSLCTWSRAGSRISRVQARYRSPTAVPIPMHTPATQIHIQIRKCIPFRLCCPLHEEINENEDSIPQEPHRVLRPIRRCGAEGLWLGVWDTGLRIMLSSTCVPYPGQH